MHKSYKNESKKVFGIKKKQVIDQIKAIRKYKASKTIMKTLLRSVKPILVELSNKNYYRYAVPKVVLNRSQFMDLGSPNAYPVIVMAALIYNLFKDIMSERLTLFKICRIWFQYVIKFDSDKSKNVKNLERSECMPTKDIRSISVFWYYR